MIVSKNVGRYVKITIFLLVLDTKTWKRLKVVCVAHLIAVYFIYPHSDLTLGNRTGVKMLTNVQIKIYVSGVATITKSLSPADSRFGC